MAKWVNGTGAKTTRHATSWVIKRFVDPDAEILYGATNEERCPDVLYEWTTPGSD